MTSLPATEVATRDVPSLSKATSDVLTSSPTSAVSSESSGAAWSYYYEKLASLQQAHTATVAALNATIIEQERTIAALRATHSAPTRAATQKQPSKPLDIRTVAECWLARETPIRPKKNARIDGRAQTVSILFADAIEIRLSTYIDGALGVAEATRTARAIRQGQAPASAPRWRLTPNGWRAVEITSCPDVLLSKFIDA